MRDVVVIDEKAQGRQFWLRVFLVMGILWGFLPFVMAPFITKGPNDTYFDIVASVLNSVTILPACALAFWHRRIACLWLSVNAVVIGTALVSYIGRTGKHDSMMIFEVCGPIVIALLVDVLELLRWPPAVVARRRSPKAR